MRTFCRQIAPKLQTTDSYIRNIEDPKTRTARVERNTLILAKTEYVAGDSSVTIDIDTVAQFAKATFLLSTFPLEATQTALPLIRLNRLYDFFSFSMTNSDFKPTVLPTEYMCGMYMQSDWLWFDPNPSTMTRDYWDVTVTFFNILPIYEDNEYQPSSISIGTESGKEVSSLLNTSINSIGTGLEKSSRNLSYDMDEPTLIYNIDSVGSFTNDTNPIILPHYKEMEVRL